MMSNLIVLCCLVAVSVSAVSVTAPSITRAKTGEKVAQVHDFIANAACKTSFIRYMRPACVNPITKECFPHGSSSTYECVDIDLWQWTNLNDKTGLRSYAPGVTPSPIHRVTHNGDDAQKVVWAYTGSIHQGEAYQVYNPIGQVTVQQLLNTPINHITFIANVNVETPDHWFSPGTNNTDGCGQLQTWELPFGYNGTANESLPVFQANLKQLKAAGLTVTLTMGSWCTQFPVDPSEEWSEADFQAFVSYFETLRTGTFGGVLDGIDFDWEGFCKFECLKGACSCGWDDAFCGQFSPEELAQGQTWMVPSSTGGEPAKMMCWILPTKSTIQVMTGITNWMKKAGYVVTLAPMSTAVYSGEADPSQNQNMRNEYVKYRMQPYPGGRPIDGSGQVNLLDLVDGVLLQWYSGFDAALCINSKDPKACTCDNVPDADYPNVLNVSNGDGQISAYYSESGAGGNMFPTTFPVRCQACGPNVLFPNGTRGNWSCAPPGEDWFVPGNGQTNYSITQSHIAGLQNYVATHNSIPYWWVQGLTVNSKCPRSIDCPDWRYENEANYSRQLTLLQSIGAVVDLNKVTIGFETLGIDVSVQMQAYQDPALPWTAITPDQASNGLYYTNCTQNMTVNNVGQELRCAQPLLSQQWGLKFSADDMLGLTAVIQKQLGKTLAGIGMFTLDGVLWQPAGNTKRYWYDQMMLLNETYMIPCHGDTCGQWVPPNPPSPPSPPSGQNVCNPAVGCNVCSQCCQSYLKDQADCDACVTAQCAPAPVCNPATCNVCAACCQSYLQNPADCAACAKAQC